jgi:hypothetical protein
MSFLLAQSTLPPPASIRDAAREVVSRPYFKLDSSSGSDGTSFLRQLLEWLIWPFKWIYDHTQGVPEVLRWVIVGLCFAICVALIAHILYTLIKAMSVPIARGRLPLDSTAREIDPSEFEKQADGASAGGDYISAVRLLFRAALRRLEIFEKKKLRPGITNRELLRRYRATPLADSMLSFVNTIELKWYGQAPCEQADYVTCRHEHGRICQYIRDSKPADGA